MEVNWREKRGKRNLDGFDWRFYLQVEFVEFLEEVEDISSICDWNLWGGGVNNYAVTISQAKRDGKSISIRINPGDNYYYYACFEKEWNPNNIDSNKYQECIGKTKEEAISYLKTFLKELVALCILFPIIIPTISIINVSKNCFFILSPS